MINTIYASQIVVYRCSLSLWERWRVITRRRGALHRHTFFKMHLFCKDKDWLCYAPLTRDAGAVSLRFGHATALTVRRTVIHYRVALRFPKGEPIFIFPDKPQFTGYIIAPYIYYNKEEIFSAECTKLFWKKYWFLRKKVLHFWFHYVILIRRDWVRWCGRWLQRQHLSCHLQGISAEYVRFSNRAACSKKSVRTGTWNCRTCPISRKQCLFHGFRLKLTDFFMKQRGTHGRVYKFFTAIKLPN